MITTLLFLFGICVIVMGLLAFVAVLTERAWCWWQDHQHADPSTRQRLNAAIDITNYRRKG